MKTFVRTLWNQKGQKILWENDYKKLQLRNYLNELGFYVLNGIDDSLDVYLINTDSLFEKKYFARILQTLLDITKI